MKVLFIFIDGIGLGPNDPGTNPFAFAKMPVLEKLLGGNRMTIDAVPWESDHATLIALDACMGVEGLPQSATGQAALLTGRNISAEIGGHYGPKPNTAVAQALKNGNIFNRLKSEGFNVTFLNAYPPSYFDSIESGRRLYAAIPLAASNAGIRLRTVEDLFTGLAVSADFTARGWKTHLGIKEIPVITLENAGIRLANLAKQHDFSLFEWKPPESFKNYILDLNIVKENTENDIFFHINKGNMKIVYIRKNNLLYTIGAENEVQFQILEALIEYIDKRFHEVFAVDVILSYENVNPIAFKNFKDEMDQIIENIDALNILRPVDVFCRICKRKLSLHLKKSLIEEATSHPVPIVFTHEGHAIVCYIDQNFVVRGVEFVATTG